MIKVSILHYIYPAEYMLNAERFDLLYVVLIVVGVELWRDLCNLVKLVTKYSSCDICGVRDDRYDAAGHLMVIFPARPLVWYPTNLQI